MASVDNSLHWEEFYSTHLPPTDFEDNRILLREFCERHNKIGQRIVLITSGGTTVPLEHNTVRFVDNFSGGVRGAASTEYFLEQNYAVIFLHRLKSLEPFTRHFGGQKFLDMLELDDRGPNTTITVKPDSVDVLAPVLASYKAAQESGRILYVNFTTVSDYFWLLRAACECLASCGPTALLYLAAAVSDFYIPTSQIPTHKIQSASGVPNIQLQLAPKMLAPLVSLWVPHAFVVSFKLETDENILISKARGALTKYKHALVIGNLLQTRRTRVVFVTPSTSFEVCLTREQMLSGIEIEDMIVSNVISSHTEFIKEHHY
ncbi:phosphopantothenoylcysteine synthetase [Leptinotarsa decemlineata]|uniref:phosphopantothenoylcysteine synthetase n=1 Tax=Leptinotarsa decemlineata TaxID=7539 RepID=UPI003D30BE7B